MNKHIPTLGIRFDISKTNSADYGEKCWETFWRIIDIQKLRGALLFEGDTSDTASGKENVYCIAIQSSSTATLEEIQTALEKNTDFQKIAASPAVIRDNGVVHEPLIDTGNVNVSGELMGGINSRSALEAIRNRSKPVIPELSDADLHPFKCMYDVDRPVLGLRPLPMNAKINIRHLSGEDARATGCDTMVNVWDGFVRQSVFFRRVGGNFEWIGEQEVYFKKDMTEPLNSWNFEKITINYFVESMPNAQKGYSVKYVGSNKQLASTQPLELDDVRPELTKWGFQR